MPKPSADSTQLRIWAQQNKGWLGVACGGIAGAVLGAITSLVAMERTLEETSKLTSVQTRISACTSLADHYHKFADSPSTLTVEIGEGEDKKIMEVADNSDRRNKAINMARALSLCLANNSRADDVDRCIVRTTTNGAGKLDSYVSVVDTTTSNLPESGFAGKGANNPAC